MGVGSVGRTRARIVVALAVAIGLALPANASAGQTIGQASAASSCTPGEAYTQGPVFAGTYSPSAPVVITSWNSFANATSSSQLELLVLKPNPALGPTHFVATHRDTPRTLTQASALNTFSGMHIPIEVGEQLGLYLPTAADCFIDLAGDTGLFFTDGDPPLNVDVDFTGANTDRRLNASAVVEPDADRDGFGDETQDACPSSAASQGTCPIRRKKCKKHKKHREAGAAKKKRCKKKRR